MIALFLIFIPLWYALPLPWFPKNFVGRYAMLGFGAEVLVALAAALAFHSGTPIAFSRPWLGMLGSDLAFRADNLSIVMVVVTAVGTGLIALGLPTKLEKDRGAFYAYLFALESFLMGVFLAHDGLLFYVFWELSLITAFFMLLKWNNHPGSDGFKTYFRFLIFSILGSFALLTALIMLIFSSSGQPSFSFDALLKLDLGEHAKPIFWLFFLAFAIKTPLVPLHMWQPETYSRAAMPVTMVMAALMSKMGLYGFLRFAPLLEQGLAHTRVCAVGLCILSVIYGSVLACQQSDLRKLLAFSSIGHLGLVAAGTLAGNPFGSDGALIQIVAHTLVTIGLFAVVQTIEESKGTSELGNLASLKAENPVFARYFFLLLLGNIAVPLTLNFVGEFLLLRGIYEVKTAYLYLAIPTVLISAVYMLNLFQKSMLITDSGRVSCGPGSKLILSQGKTVTLVVVVVLIFGLGLFPKVITHGFLSSPGGM